MKKQLILCSLSICILFLFAAQSAAQTTIDKAQLVGTWQVVDSLGRPLQVHPDILIYKIFTPETFSNVGVVKSKGYFVGLTLGTYVLENDSYIETICFSNAATAGTVGNKNLNFIHMENDLLYIWNSNDKREVIFQKIDSLPTFSPADISRIIKEESILNPDVSKMKFEGGDGTSISKAVLIRSKTEREGIKVQHNFIRQRYGIKDVDWRVVTQSCKSENNKMYAAITIRLKNNVQKQVYFNITSYYPKMAGSNSSPTSTKYKYVGKIKK